MTATEAKGSSSGDDVSNAAAVSADDGKSESSDLETHRRELIKPAIEWEIPEALEPLWLFTAADRSPLKLVAHRTVCACASAV